MQQTPGYATRTGASPRYGHQMCLLSVSGGGLSLPLDVEPYGPGDSELAAGLRLLHRAVRHLGRFADYAVVDAEYANARFLKEARQFGLQVVARLKANLPELFQAARRRFSSQPPPMTFREGDDWIEGHLWTFGTYLPDVGRE